MASKVVLFALVATCLSISAMAQSVLGCCLDHSATDLPFKLYVGSTVTNSVCMNWCKDAGYVYSGTQNGNECWCGNQYCTVGQLGASSCNKPCAGNANEKCGGLGINSVTRTTPAAYLGCYIETENRELAYRGPDTSEPNTCVAICQNAGYAYAGMQYWNQCWCGNSYGNYGISTASGYTDCTPCGNAGQMCGKAYRNAVYKI